MADQNVVMHATGYGSKHWLLYLDAPMEYVPEKGATGQILST